MRRIVLLVGAIVALFIVTRNRPPPLLEPKPATVTATVAATSAVPAAASAPASTAQAGSGNEHGPATTTVSSSKGFRSRDRLDEHYSKHGGEFGDVSKAQYLALAQTLRDSQTSENILEIVRQADGVVSRFDKKSGAFLAFDHDGTIRTFFKPNDGERYFRRQANRPPSP